MFVFALLTIAAAAPAIGPAPGELVIDGDLGEWAGPPTLEIGPEDQFFGKDKASGPDDASAQIWLAIDAAGLRVAAHISDDEIFLVNPDTEGNAVVRSDHLELWISFGEPPFPPLGYRSRFAPSQLTEVPDEAACPEKSRYSDCPSWRAAQLKWRRALTEGFRSQLLLSPAGVHRVVAGRVLQPVGEVRVALGEADWRLEATIPWEVLPLTPTEPIAQAWVLAELVDNDQGFDRQETMLSTSKDRKTSDASTWSTLSMEPPSAATHGSRFTAKVGTGGWFRPSDPATDEVHRFVNPVSDSIFYKDHPPSPAEWVIELPFEPLWTKGEVSVWVATREERSYLVATVNGQMTGDAELFCPRTDWPIDDGDGIVVIGTCASFKAAHTTGPGGANPWQVLHVHRVGADGVVRKVLFETADGEAVRRVRIGRSDGRVRAVRLRGETYLFEVGDEKLELVWADR